MHLDDALPRGYIGSTGVPADLTEMRDLVDRTERSITGSSTITEDTLATMFGAPSFDPDTDVVTVRDPEGRLVAASMFQRRPPFVRSWTDAWVDPDHVGMGIGSAIVDWSVDRALGEVANAPEGTRVTMSMGANERNARARRLFTAKGFVVNRFFLEMRIDLDRPIDIVPLPDGISLRTLSPAEDVDELSAAVTASFRDHYGFTESTQEESIARWRQFRTSDLWDDSLVWLAESDGAIVGMNVCLRANGSNEDQGYVATIGVLPVARGRGLARSMLTTSFAEYAQRGKATVSLHVDADSLTGATRLYRGVGMREVQREVDWERELRAGEDIVVR
jgi:mycothiol synthase